ncbi:hypothetical protein CRV24_002224 [Beauveria bassiana]|nr:hypothetical protein CRV24_002224 [Beauveria bassiana]
MPNDAPRKCRVSYNRNPVDTCSSFGGTPGEAWCHECIRYSATIINVHYHANYLVACSQPPIYLSKQCLGTDLEQVGRVEMQMVNWCSGPWWAHVGAVGCCFVVATAQQQIPRITRRSTLEQGKQVK